MLRQGRVVGNDGESSEQAIQARTGAWLLVLALLAAILGPAAPALSGSTFVELRQVSHELAVEPEASGDRTKAEQADPFSSDPPVEQPEASRLTASSWHRAQRALELSASPSTAATSAGHSFEARGPPLS